MVGVAMSILAEYLHLVGIPPLPEPSLFGAMSQGERECLVKDIQRHWHWMDETQPTYTEGRIVVPKAIVETPSGVVILGFYFTTKCEFEMSWGEWKKTFRRRLCYGS